MGFTESLSNCKTFTGSNLHNDLYLYVITQTSKTVNVDHERNYLHVLKTSFNNYTLLRYFRIDFIKKYQKYRYLA